MRWLKCHRATEGYKTMMQSNASFISINSRQHSQHSYHDQNRHWSGQVSVPGDILNPNLSSLWIRMCIRRFLVGLRCLLDQHARARRARWGARRLVLSAPSFLMCFALVRCRRESAGCRRRWDLDGSDVIHACKGTACLSLVWWIAAERFCMNTRLDAIEEMDRRGFVCSAMSHWICAWILRWDLASILNYFSALSCSLSILITKLGWLLSAVI